MVSSRDFREDASVQLSFPISHELHVRCAKWVAPAPAHFSVTAAGILILPEGQALEACEICQDGWGNISCFSLRAGKEV